jgi:sulfatase maturation enzyme AslB (radical SAM superfamily)
MIAQFRKIHNSLPIFSIPENDKTILYTPGEIKIYPSKLISGSIDISDYTSYENVTDQIKDDIVQLICAAEISENKWNDLFQREFKPECLTIYPGNACNLNCKYCYVKEKNEKIIDKEFVKAAAEYTAKYCAREKGTFYLVFHGGGEPTFHWSLLQDLYRIVHQICAKYKVPVFSYIATNGILSRTQTQWLAKHFNRIGVSCDGFPEIHDSQRYSSSLTLTSATLKKNISALLELNDNIDVRVTITPQSMLFMENIATYFIHEMHIKNIRVEPVYSHGKIGFNPDDAEIYATHFMNASDIAQRLGATVSYSGVRMNEIHSCYCDVLRNTVRITADNEIINCFFDSTSNYIKTKYNKLGSLTGNCIGINNKQIQKIKEVLQIMPATCRECINMVHCSRACPEYCSLAKQRNTETYLTNNFRCLLNKKLAIRHIKEKARNFVI